MPARVFPESKQNGPRDFDPSEGPRLKQQSRWTRGIATQTGDRKAVVALCANLSVETLPGAQASQVEVSLLANLGMRLIRRQAPIPGHRTEKSVCEEPTPGGRGEPAPQDTVTLRTCRSGQPKPHAWSDRNRARSDSRRRLRSGNRSSGTRRGLTSFPQACARHPGRPSNPYRSDRR